VVALQSDRGPALESLSLSSLCLGDDRAAEFARTIRLRQIRTLTSLSLACAEYDPTAASDLTAVVRSFACTRRLQRLHLLMPSTDDTAVMEAVAELLTGNMTLTDVRLPGTCYGPPRQVGRNKYASPAVDPEPIEALAEAISSNPQSALTALDITPAQLSSDAKEALKKLLQRPQFMPSLGPVTAAWTAAAVTVAFVRANHTHPFALSVLPLIPSIIALTDRTAPAPAAVSLKCDRRLRTRFGACVIVPSDGDDSAGDDDDGLEGDDDVELGAGVEPAASADASAAARGVKRPRSP
jgi:hypothetical protein